MIFNFLTNETKKKKLIQFSNYADFERFFQMEQNATQLGDSVIIEQAIWQHYLNEYEPIIAQYVYELLLEEDGMRKTAAAIFDWFALHPEKADDSLLPLIDFILSIEITKHNLNITIDEIEDGLRPYADSFREYRNMLEKYRSIPSPLYGESYPFPEDKQERPYRDLDSDIDIINQLLRCLEPDDDLHMIYHDVYVVMKTIRDNWYCGFLKDEEEQTYLRNWSITHTLLSALCRVGNWDDRPHLKFELSKKIKQIRTDADSPVFNPDKKLLTQKIRIKDKTIFTVEDAVLIMPEGITDTTECAYSYICLRGPQSPGTDVPFILLATTDNEEDQMTILEEKFKKNSLLQQAFWSPRMVFPAPILFEGEYVDQRVRYDRRFLTF